MDAAEIKRIATRNPGVDLELLRKAQREMEEVSVQPAQYDIEPAFDQRRMRRRAAKPRKVAASTDR